MSGADTFDVRPVVRTAKPGQLGVWVFGAILLAGGFGVFTALSAGRQQAQVPATVIPEGSAGRIASPPPLRLPPGLLEDRPPLARNDPLASGRLQTPPAQPAPRYNPPPAGQPAPAFQPQQVLPPVQLQEAGPRTVFSQPRMQADIPGLVTSAPLASDRTEAGRLANPSLTVPQGTVIPAVLETAFDSTRAGAARALVQRDVFSFDGSRVLIPRGSRLYGTSEGGLSLGERRAQIRWTRLLRPDGVTIALDSPASDPLGRAGITGDVNSRFLTRFGGAILQSFLDLGVGAATRAASDGVIVALPGSTQNVVGERTQNVQPVLRVDQGTSVSVFVARDLDFAAVER